jgi:hypothetical protein
MNRLDKIKMNSLLKNVRDLENRLAKEKGISFGVGFLFGFIASIPSVYAILSIVIIKG